VSRRNRTPNSRVTENVIIEWRVKVLRDGKTAAIDTEGPRHIGTQGHQTSSRLPSAGDEDLLPGGDVIQQPRQVRLGLVDTNGLSHKT
jgi:hypothetical protein